MWKRILHFISPYLSFNMCKTVFFHKMMMRKAQPLLGSHCHPENWNVSAALVCYLVNSSTDAVQRDVQSRAILDLKWGSQPYTGPLASFRHRSWHLLSHRTSLLALTPYPLQSEFYYITRVDQLEVESYVHCSFLTEYKVLPAVWLPRAGQVDLWCIWADLLEQ